MNTELLPVSQYTIERDLTAMKGVGIIKRNSNDKMEHR